MKKIIYFVCLSILIFLFSEKALAQEVPQNESNIVIVATAGIEEASVVSQEQNKIKLKFKINNQEGNQPGIRYAVELTGKVNQVLLDSRVYEEVISLGPKETISREVEYVAPAFLSGNFFLWVKAFNEKGLPLGVGMAGEIKLSGSNEYLEIAVKDCYISVKDELGKLENKKYSTSFGVDVDPKEELIGHCKITSKFKEEKNFSPSIKTYWRSYLGEMIKTDKLEAITLKAGESLNFSFVIPKASRPQAYDAVLTFLDEKNNQISSAVPFRYVLRGQSATFQNFVLDKDYYQKGESAQISFNWLPAADNFNESRKTGTSIGEIFLNVEIKDGQGVLCASVEKKKINESEVKTVFTMLMTKDCTDPQVSLSILDQKGETLDEAELVFKASFQEVAATSEEKEGKEATGELENLKNVLILISIVIAVLALISIIIIIFNKKKNENI